MTTIDITELLEDYVRLLEKGGVPRTSTESKVMLMAKEEIERLRKSVEFAKDENERNNNSRLHLLDVIHNSSELYERTCKRVRKDTDSSFVCDMCQHFTVCKDLKEKVPDFGSGNCFELNINKFNSIVFEKDVKKPQNEKIKEK